MARIKFPKNYHRWSPEKKKEFKEQAFNVSRHGTSRWALNNPEAAIKRPKYPDIKSWPTEKLLLPKYNHNIDVQKELLRRSLLAQRNN